MAMVPHLYQGFRSGTLLGGIDLLARLGIRVIYTMTTDRLWL
jgi:hypothetical protein